MAKWNIKEWRNFGRQSADSVIKIVSQFGKMPWNDYKKFVNEELKKVASTGVIKGYLGWTSGIKNWFGNLAVKYAWAKYAKDKIYMFLRIFRKQHTKDKELEKGRKLEEAETDEEVDKAIDDILS